MRSATLSGSISWPRPSATCPPKSKRPRCQPVHEERVVAVSTSSPWWGWKRTFGSQLQHASGVFPKDLTPLLRGERQLVDQLDGFPRVKQRPLGAEQDAVHAD